VHDDVDFVKAAVGASGARYVIKQFMTADLVPAIRATLAGKLFLSCLDASPTILMAGGVT
jgi:DNA-binding NarL/FixJ family response regulator